MPRPTPASRWPLSRATFSCRWPARFSTPTTGSIVKSVPDVWLPAGDGLADPAAHGAAYVDYLTRRLAVHRKLAEEAERVRTGA